MGQSREPKEGTSMATKGIARRVAAPLAIALALVLVGCSGGDPGPSATPSGSPSTTSPSPLPNIVYTHPKPPFTVAYPGNWLSTARPTPTQPVAAGEGTGRNMNVALEKLPSPPPTLQEYADSAKIQLEGLGLTIDETGTATLGGQPAAYIQSTNTDKQGIILWQVFALRGGYAFVLTYGAPPKEFDAAQAQEIADSFTFGR